MGPPEGIRDDFRPEFTDPDVVRGAQGTVLVEDLVGHIPLLDLAGVPSHHGGDVVLQDGTEFFLAEVALFQPGGGLAVPEKCVSTEDRESTSLNSKHPNNSYDVFCFKKKK